MMGCSMRCERAQTAWLATQHEAEKATPELLAHLAECETCRAFQRADGRLSRLLSLDENEPVGPGFDTRFFARLQTHKASQQDLSAPAGRRRTRARRVRAFFLWALPAAGAAAATALLAIGYFHSPTPSAPPTGDLDFAMHLEMLEAMSIVERLDELEALAQVERDDALREALESGQIDELLVEVDPP